MTEKIITKDQVKKIAQLSKLELTDAETEKYAELFTSTLEYMNILEELDTSGMEPTFQVTGSVNVFREIEKGSQTLSRDEALMNAKRPVNGLFGTEAVFDRE